MTAILGYTLSDSTLPDFVDFKALRPQDVSGYYVDIDFNDPACYTVSGGNITTVTSKAGVTNTIAINGTIPFSGVIGPAKGITISTTGQILTIGPPLSPAPSWSVLAVVNINTTVPQSNIGAIVVDNGAINTGNGFGFYASAKAGGYAYTLNAPGATIATRAASTTQKGFGPAILACSVTPNLGIMQVNATEVYRSTGDVTTKTNNGAIRVGAYSTTQFPAPGVYSRIIVYNTNLTDKQLIRISRTIAADYGLTL